MNQEPEQNKKPLDKEENVPLYKVLLSVLQASFGVQNSANRERDFTRGKAIHYVITAIIFTVVFVLGLIMLVKVVISQT